MLLKTSLRVVGEGWRPNKEARQKNPGGFVSQYTLIEQADYYNRLTFESQEEKPSEIERLCISATREAMVSLGILTA